MTDLQLPEPYCQEPDRYTVNRNGSITDTTTHRFVAGGGAVPVPAEKDTRITSDSSHPQSGARLAGRKWTIHRELIEQKILAEAIKGNKARIGVDAAEVVATVHAELFKDSQSKKHKLSERLKVLSYTQRVLYPGMVLDERQRSPVIPGGMRIDLSKGAAEQLLGTLLGVTGDTVEGESRELAEDDE